MTFMEDRILKLEADVASLRLEVAGKAEPIPVYLPPDIKEPPKEYLKPEKIVSLEKEDPFWHNNLDKL